MSTTKTSKTNAGNPYDAIESMMEDIEDKMEELKASVADTLMEIWKIGICLEVNRARLNRKEMRLKEKETSLKRQEMMLAQLSAFSSEDSEPLKTKTHLDS